MGKYIQAFQELSLENFNLAGGKGGVLAKLYQKGYPVPDGFIIFPTAFEHGKLTEEAKEEVNEIYNLSKREQKRYVVRSSALNEDSIQASFAGEFETVLDVKTEEDYSGS